MDYNNTHKVELAKKIYLYLAAIFITSLVVSNLIFQKFHSSAKRSLYRKNRDVFFYYLLLKYRSTK